MEWLNTTLEKLQAGDVETAIMVLLALLVIFFVFKLMMNTLKAIVIVAAVIVVIAVMMPESDVINKAKDMGSDAVDFVKENATQETMDAIKDKASDLTDAVTQ